MRFDWYSATVEQGPDWVLGELGRLGALQPARPLYGYEEACQVETGRDVVARAFWGGVNGREHVHVQTSGDPCPEVVEIIREHWPRHRVSRADACQDYSDPKAWRRLSKLALGVAERHSVKTQTAGDWIGREDGRTLYVGGRTAYVRMRVYEKGKQLGPLTDDPHRVRVEVQVRPQGPEAKSALALAEPPQLMQCSKWTAELAVQLGVPALESISVRPQPSPGSEERMRFWLAHQYGECLKRWGDEVGWLNLAAAIDDIRSRDPRRRSH